MSTYQIHPIAELFPPFTDAEFNELVKDIGVNGQREPITLFEGKILDGVNRYKACERLHLVPRVRNYTGTDPLGFSASENLKRRHLNEGQRALIAAEIANRNGGRPSNRSQLTTVSNKAAAKAFNVSEVSVDRAKKVLKHAPKEDVKAIVEGKTSINAVAKKIKSTKEKKLEHKDEIGRIIPEGILSEWDRSIELSKELKRHAQAIVEIMRNGVQKNDPLFREYSNAIISQAEGLRYAVTVQLRGHAVCHNCQGRQPKQCQTCHGRGFYSKYYFESPSVPEKIKKLLGAA